MATLIINAAPTNATLSQFYAWSRPISQFLATCGWIQQPDTGQIVWPVSLISITSATGTGTVATYTYTVLQGGSLRVGQSINIQGFVANTGYNGTFIITGLPLANTFTVANTTSTTETIQAYASVGIQVAISNAVGNGTTNTYTYTNTDGVLMAGQTIVITGATTTGFNGTFVIGSVVGSTFITTSGISHASEAETATGIIAAAAPTTGLSLASAPLTGALQNATVTLGTVTASANAASGNTAYTVASGVLASQVGQQFIVTGMANPINNGTFICIATSGTTGITLSNPNGVVSTVQTGSMSSSSSILTFIGSFTNASFAPSTVYTVTLSGTGNMGTFTSISAAPDAGAATAYFTVAATGTTITAAGTATTTAPSLIPPLLGTFGGFNLEVWKMGDGNALPVYLIIGFGSGAVTTTPEMSLILATGTNGAGVATGGNTGQLYFPQHGAGSSSATIVPTYLSGSTNRFQMAQFIGTLAVAGGVLNIERSHDSSGNDTASYATYATVSNANTPVSAQISIVATSSTTPEIKLAALQVHGTGTGSFGVSTCLCPVFPLVGAIGNPMLGLLVGKKVDWFDQTQFPFTMYNSAHNYIVINQTFLNTANVITADVLGTCCVSMRFE